MREELPPISRPLPQYNTTTDWSEEAANIFAYLVPPAYQQKIDASAQPDALLRQVLPVAEELLDTPGFSKNPLAEAPGAGGGLIEKYQGRLLVMVTQACAGHCRFCFRRHMLDSPKHQDTVKTAFRKRMEGHSDITEVILSGGDPLVLSDRKLESWLTVISAYPQVQRIRIHSREPVFSPERFTPDLLDILRRCTLPVVLAVHVNHPDELDGETAKAIERLREAGVLLLTQTVLLRGVNDSADTLARLFERAVKCGMTPYYLHQLDRVAGAAHFEVDPDRGLAILRELRDLLPGYMVPRYVQEVPGEGSKHPVG
jgi:EF-P beta-lysylation protein EpmB